MDRINSYALVCYVSGPLGRFLDSLREEFVTGCRPHAHVTVLPPRELNANPFEAGEEICSAVQNFVAFEAEATTMEIFPDTHVVYLDVGRGREEFLHLHGSVNRSLLLQQEKFVYHPHLTIIQNLASREQAEAFLAVAAARWAEFQGSRVFSVDHLTFVQNTRDDRWIDLMECELRRAVALQSR